MISASQINTVIGCLRRWGLEKLDHHRTEPHRSAVVGTETHSILEAWEVKGAPPDTERKLVIDGVEYRPGRTAMNGLHHLPPPGPHLSVESAFEFDHWTGRIDFAWVAINGLYLPREQWLRMKDSADVIPGAGDHKTTGSRSFEYALDESTLLKDPQSVLYGAALHREFPAAREADRLWVYYNTRPPYRSKKVHLRVSKEETLYRLEPMNKLAEELLRLRGSGLKGNDLPPNTMSCSKYGGCPHRGGHCKLTNEEVIRGYMTTNGQSGMSTEQMIAMATQQASGAMMTTVPAPALAPPVGEWITHEQQPTHEWNTATREVRLKQVLPPPVIMPPPILAPQPVVMPPAVMMPPPVTSVAALPPIVAVGPDGLPFGSVNPPESLGVQQRAQPLVAATPQADDLDGMDKKQLVELAGRMGVDVKRIQEKGIRDRLRAARASGVTPTGVAMAAQAAAIIANPFGVSAVPSVIVPPPPVVGTMPSGTPVTMNEAPLFEATSTQRVVDIICAVIRTSGPNFDVKQVVGWAKSVVAEIESGS